MAYNIKLYQIYLFYNLNYARLAIKRAYISI